MAYDSMMMDLPDPLPPEDQPRPKSCPHCGAIGVYVRGQWMSFTYDYVHHCPVLEEKLKKLEEENAQLKKSLENQIKRADRAEAYLYKTTI